MTLFRPLVARMRAVFVGVVLIQSVSATAVRCQSTKADESAIRAARGRSNSAIAAHDVDATIGVMLPEYIGLSSGNTQSIGRDAVRLTYTQIFSSRPGVVFVRTPGAITVNLKWKQAGETGYWTGQWSTPGGLIRVRGVYFAKWRKVGGVWLILSETFVQTSCAGGPYCDAPPGGDA